MDVVSRFRLQMYITKRNVCKILIIRKSCWDFDELIIIRNYNCVIQNEVYLYNCSWLIDIELKCFGVLPVF